MSSQNLSHNVEPTPPLNLQRTQSPQRNRNQMGFNYPSPQPNIPSHLLGTPQRNPSNLEPSSKPSFMQQNYQPMSSSQTIPGPAPSQSHTPYQPPMNQSFTPYGSNQSPHYNFTPSQPQIVEKIIEKPTYIDRVIQKPIYIEVEKIIQKEVPQFIERIQEIEVPQYIEKIVYLDKIIEKPVEQIVYIDQVVEKPASPQFIDQSDILQRQIQRLEETLHQQRQFKDYEIYTLKTKLNELQNHQKTQVPIKDPHDQHLIETMQNRIKQLEHSIESIQNQTPPPVEPKTVYYQDQSQIQELNEKNDQLLKDLQKFHSALLQQTNEIDTLREQVRHLERENDILQKQEQQNDPNENLYKELQTKNQENQKLRRMLNDLERDLDDARNQNDEPLQLIASTNKPHGSPNEPLTNYDNHVSALQNQIRRLNAVVRTYQSEFNQSKDRRNSSPRQGNPLF